MREELVKLGYSDSEIAAFYADMAQIERDEKDMADAMDAHYAMMENA